MTERKIFKMLKFGTMSKLQIYTITYELNFYFKKTFINKIPNTAVGRCSSSNQIMTLKMVEKITVVGTSNVNLMKPIVNF